MSVEGAVQVLTERRNWLTARIAAKNQVGWDVVWDTRERDALSVAIDELDKHQAPAKQGKGDPLPSPSAPHVFVGKGLDLRP